MAVKINLLDWRTERTMIRRQQFIAMVAVGAVAGLLIIVCAPQARKIADLKDIGFLGIGVELDRIGEEVGAVASYLALNDDRPWRCALVDEQYELEQRIPERARHIRNARFDGGTAREHIDADAVAIRVGEGNPGYVLTRHLDR